MMQAGVLPVAMAVLATAAAPAAAAEDALPESQLIDEVGDCVVKQEPGLSWQLMKTKVGSSVEHSVLVTIGEHATKCMRTAKLVMPGWVLRGTIAGARMRANQELAQAKLLPVLHPGRAADSPNKGVLARGFAACVAAEDPAGVSEIVAQRLGTSASQSAAVALQPAMSACIPERVELHILPPELRIDLAEALYERLHGPAILASPEKRTN